MKTMMNRQRGLSLSGLLFVAVVLIFAAVGAMKLIPAYMQSAQVQNVFDAIVQDPEMQKASVRDIRMSYIKRASINDITAVKAEDVEVEKDANGISLSTSYTVKIPVAGNAILLLEFNIRSPK